MAISLELTPEQRSALAASPGGPVEIVDPDTKKKYVLLAQEQFEKAQALLGEPHPAPSSPPLAIPQPLADLPVPPPVIDEMRRRSRQLGWRGRKALQDLEDELKLQYYYGGLCVNYLRTTQGIVVLAAGRSGSPAYQEQLQAIPAEQRPRLVLSLPPRFNDETAEILTPHDDES